METEFTDDFKAIRIDNPSDLEVGKKFLDTQLIIQSGEGRMSTIRHEEGNLGARQYDMIRSHYDVDTSKGHTTVSFISYDEVFKNEDSHPIGQHMLEVTSLW